MQWVVFEFNGEVLWVNVCVIVCDFFVNEWVSGVLLGDKFEKVFFVCCDCFMMMQNDFDNGWLVCLIGVVLLCLVEFVIFCVG